MPASFTRAVRSLEADPDDQRQKVPERQCGFVERTRKSIADVRRKSGLLTLEAVERFVELRAHRFVFVREPAAHGVDGRRCDPRVARDRTNCCTADPHGSFSMHPRPPKVHLVNVRMPSCVELGRYLITHPLLAVGFVLARASR